MHRASFIPSRSAWVAEPGSYTIAIDSSSLDIRQHTKFNLGTKIVAEKKHHSFALDKPLQELTAK